MSAKISKLNKLKDKLNYQSLCKPKMSFQFKTFMPRTNIAAVSRQNEQSARPLTCATTSPKVFLDMSYQIFSPRANNRKILKTRGNSVF